MNPLHLLWICPLSALSGIFLLAFCIGSHDSREIVEALKEDTEHYQFLPAAPPSAENDNNVQK